MQTTEGRQHNTWNAQLGQAHDLSLLSRKLASSSAELADHLKDCQDFLRPGYKPPCAGGGSSAFDQGARNLVPQAPSHSLSMDPARMGITSVKDRVNLPARSMCDFPNAPLHIGSWAPVNSEYRQPAAHWKAPPYNGSHAPVNQEFREPPQHANTSFHSGSWAPVSLDHREQVTHSPRLQPTATQVSETPPSTPQSTEGSVDASNCGSTLGQPLLDSHHRPGKTRAHVHGGSHRDSHVSFATDGAASGPDMVRTRSVSMTCSSPFVELERRRTSLGTTLASFADLVPIMCEVEYPWIVDKPVLFLSKLPKQISPASTGVKAIEATSEMKTRIASYLHDDIDFADNIRTALYVQSNSMGPFWKVIFKDITIARRTKFASKAARHLKITLTAPDAAPRHKTDVFITGFAHDDRRALLEVFTRPDLESEKPCDVSRLTADYDEQKKDATKLTWRVSYHCEEAARWVHGYAALEGKKLGLTAAYQPNPFTKGLVICFRSPGVKKEVFQKLKLYTPTKDKFIVEDFKYAMDTVLPIQEKGDCFYDIVEESLSKNNNNPTHGTKGYARLVSQNWWYGALFWALIFAGLALMDLYSNIIYAASLFSGDGLASNARYNVDYRYNFLLSFFGLQGFILKKCWTESETDITQQCTGSGDLLKGETWMDRVQLKSASFTFFFVQIPGMVKDIVKTLHPWTNVQEKAAAKINGCRVFLIGFPNAQMFRVNDQMGMHKQFPPIIMSRFVLTLFKVFHAYSSRSWSSMFLCMAAVVLWPMQFSSFKSLLSDRRQLCDYMQQQALEQSVPTNNLKDLQSKKDTLPPKTKGLLSNWEKHFGNFNDLGGYNQWWDAVPYDFWITVLILCIANIFIGVLHWIGVLKWAIADGAGLAPLPDLSAPTNATSGVHIRSLLSTLLAADLNGDAILSTDELANGPASVRKLAMLLEEGHFSVLQGV